MTEYRKIKGSEVWHWCESCPSWPDEGYLSRTEKPTDGKLCDGCKKECEK